MALNKKKKTGGHRIISRVREAQKRKHFENEHQISPILELFSPAFSMNKNH
jgi:hypothetical protein